MLGHVIGVNAGAVVGFYQSQPVFVVLSERQPGVIQVIENPELHRLPPPIGRAVLSLVFGT
jgi:hypothetical protein